MHEVIESMRLDRMSTSITSGMENVVSQKEWFCEAHGEYTTLAAGASPDVYGGPRTDMCERCDDQLMVGLISSEELQGAHALKRAGLTEEDFPNIPDRPGFWLEVKFGPRIVTSLKEAAVSLGPRGNGWRHCDDPEALIRSVLYEYVKRGREHREEERVKFVQMTGRAKRTISHQAQDLT